MKAEQMQEANTHTHSHTYNHKLKMFIKRAKQFSIQTFPFIILFFSFLIAN